MGKPAADLIHALYGHDVWEHFQPIATTDSPQGWNGNHPSLQRLAAIPGSKIVVDVGVWKGQSTITLANAIKAAGIDGCVVAVDTFLGSPEHLINRKFERAHGIPNQFQTFISNVIRAGVKELRRSAGSDE